MASPISCCWAASPRFLDGERMILPLLFLATQSAPQDPVADAVATARTLRRAARSVSDAEARLRLEAVLASMSNRVITAFFGEPEDLDKVESRFHDTRNLITRPKDQRSEDLLSWNRNDGVVSGIVDSIEDPPRGPLDEDMFIDLLKAWTGLHCWEESELSRTGEGKLLVQAPVELHQKISRVVRNLEKELLKGYRTSVQLFASAEPLVLSTDAEGALTDEAWEKLAALAGAGKTVRRLSSADLGSMPDQTVSAFSGIRRPAEDLRLPKLPDGFAVQVRVLPSGSHVLLDAGLAWTQVLSVDEVTSEARVLHFPRVAEATLQELRLLPLGKVAVLGRMGPLPAEAGPLPNLTVLVRVSKSQP